MAHPEGGERSTLERAGQRSMKVPVGSRRGAAA
jgi:hypothetical protein